MGSPEPGRRLSLVLLFLHSVTVYGVNPSLSIHPAPPSPWCPHMFSTTVSVFLPDRYVHLCQRPRFCVNIDIHLFSSCSLTSVSMPVCRSIHVSANCALSFLFLQLSNISSHTCPHLCPFLCRWTLRLLPCPGYEHPP